MKEKVTVNKINDLNEGEILLKSKMVGKISRNGVNIYWSF